CETVHFATRNNSSGARGGLADAPRDLGTCITGALGPPRLTGQPSSLRGALHRPVGTCIANALASQTRWTCRQAPPLRKVLHIQQLSVVAWPTHAKCGRRRGKLGDAPRGLDTCITNALPRPSQTQCYTCNESSVVAWPTSAKFGRRRGER
ncbi:hypothetical protein T492DRAFT_927538, partial [Pavlovales sp. CCMP2436]